MLLIFYISAAVAIVATFMAITRLNAVHALLYLIVSLLAVAAVFFCLGAAFVAALEVIVYAGAIMVLFVFVIMTLDVGPHAERERAQLTRAAWVGPGLLSAILLGEMLYALARAGGTPPGGAGATPRQVGVLLFGPYVIAVEAASLLLLAGLVGAYHLGRREGG